MMIKQIKEELKNISKWPWQPHNCVVEEIRDDHVSGITFKDEEDPAWEMDCGCPGYGLRREDARFIAKSPERIALLVEMCEEALQLAEQYSNFTTAKLFIEEWNEKLLEQNDG